jgi:perosamine synthetase
MIPVSEPLLDGREAELLQACVASGWISSSGPFVEEFERQWAVQCARKYGIAVCNGTAALQAECAALGLEPGDEVIMPTFTIISCAMAVISVGAVPVLVDADPSTWTMDPVEVARKIGPRTRAILVVHIYGHPVDMRPIVELAERHGLAVIEDAAEAHGAEYRWSSPNEPAHWRRCGSFGVMSCFSFFANKLITTGEGGMVLTDDPALADRLRSLRNLAFDPGRRFVHSDLGFNFRMTSLQAAVGLAQIERFDEIVATKRRIGTEYARRLVEIQELQLPIEQPWARSVYWMYGVVLAEETGFDAVELARRLRVAGIETRPFFVGMHQQPVYLRRGMFRAECHPVAERLARQGLYLPSGVALTEAQLDQVVVAVKHAIDQ